MQFFLYNSVYGSMATPACSNVSWCGLRKFSAQTAKCSFLEFFPNGPRASGHLIEISDGCMVRISW